MRKKFLSLALVSVFMLSLSVSAHAEAASTPASQEEARLATVFQGVADVWGSNISVAEIKTLQATSTPWLSILLLAMPFTTIPPL